MEVTELQVATEVRVENDAADATEIVAALQRLLSQPDFLASPRLAAFLQFVVTEALAGRADRLKAFTVASMALGHNEKFNPKTNSIVRVQAGRLRNLLELYYQGPGRFERHEIRLRRGSYVPEFLTRGETEPLRETGDVAAETEAPAGAPPTVFDWRKRFGRSSGKLVFAASLCLVAAGLGLGAWMLRADSSTTGFGRAPSAVPSSSLGDNSFATISVDPIEGAQDLPAISTFAALIESRLENALSGFDNPIVIHGGMLAQPPSDLDYHLSGSLRPSESGRISLAFRIWHPASGEIIWARSFDDLHLERSGAALEPVVSSLTSAVAQTYGVVFTDMRRRLRGQSDGFGCNILAFDYFKTPSVAAHAKARDCLERSIAQHPDFAPGFAALAYLMADTYLNGLDAHADENPLDVASQMAQRAVDLAPQKAYMQAAIFLTRFYDRRFEDAFESAERALRLNPYATDIPARIGAAYVLRGDFDKGIALLQRAVRFSPSQPGWYDFYFFLDAHLRGDEQSAFRHAMRRSAMRFPLGLVARIIVAHEQSDAEAVAQWSRKLVADYPAFATDIPAAFRRYAMASAISTRLLADLDAAGFPLHGQ